MEGGRGGLFAWDVHVESVPKHRRTYPCAGECLATSMECDGSWDERCGIRSERGFDGSLGFWR